MPSNAYNSFFHDRMTIALISLIAASVLFAILPTNNNNIFYVLSHRAIAQPTPYSSSHSHFSGLFYYPQDPFHSLFPVRNIEMSPLLDKAGDALSGSNLIISPNVATPDGSHSQFIKYIPGPIGEAGIAYSSAQTLDLRGAQRIVFFAKGELGGEKIAFVAIGKPSLNKVQSVGPNIFRNLNFAVISKNVTLTNDWTRYELNLNGVGTTGVIEPFGFIVSKVRSQNQVPNSNSPYPLDDANPNHIVFFLKGVTIDNNPAINPILTVQFYSTNTTATTKS